MNQSNQNHSWKGHPLSSIQPSSEDRTTPRTIKFEMGNNPYMLGSCLVSFGNTQVHVTASAEENLPGWLKGKPQGWVTAEYGMLPGSTHTRVRREKNGPSGRSQEIQRLIGRSLRSITRLEEIKDLSIIVDCDVLVADGGTRTASISGAFLALTQCLLQLMKQGKISTFPLESQLAAISVGISAKGEILADLNYEEDSQCHTDMNLVLTKEGKFVEIQGTAEKVPFSVDDLGKILVIGKGALDEVFHKQDEVLTNLFSEIGMINPFLNKR